jgi:Tfp pilus assembly protein PilO
MPFQYIIQLCPSLLSKTLCGISSQAEVQRLGISIHHKVIQERVEAIAQMKNECATLRQKLEKYEGLPPNLGQAQDMLAQVKQKYVCADQQLQTRLAKHTELTASLMSVSEASWNFRRPKDEPGNM